MMSKNAGNCIHTDSAGVPDERLVNQGIPDLHTTIHAHFLIIRFGIVAENLHYFLTHEADGFYDPQIVEMPG